jgi:hypothetical protein
MAACSGTPPSPRGTQPYVSPIAETVLYVLNRTLLPDAPVSFFP